LNYDLIEQLLLFENRDRGKDKKQISNREIKKDFLTKKVEK
jgi:hypothetical protein